MAFGFSAGGGFGAGSSVIPNDPLHGSVLVPDTELLFTATFHRHGPDLLLVGRDGREHLIPGYFSSEHHPALVAPNGAQLAADTVDLLAGSPTPGHYAQAQPALPPDAIGKVEKVVGDVAAIRNGVTVVLHVGDAVFKSDIVQTGATASCGISFPDGTALNLVANTRMALNDYTFDANANSGNGALFTLVEGTFAFVAGKVAHTGDMKITTPVATMGIRGTTGVIGQADTQNLPPEIATITANAAGETYEFSVVPDFGTGQTGVYDLYDAAGNIIATISQSGFVTFVIPQLGREALVRTVREDDHRIEFEQRLLADLFRTLNPNTQQNGGTNGSGTPQGPELFNPIPQLFEQGGTPINFTVPGSNGGPPTQTTAYFFQSGGSEAIVIWLAGAGNFDQAPGWSDGFVPGAPTSAIVVPNGGGPLKVSDAHAVNGIEVDGTGTLVIGGGGYLEDLNYIKGNGTLVLNSTGTDPTLAISGPVVLSGGGTIKMIGTAAGNHIVGVANTGAFLINIDYTIVGTGTIGDGSGDLYFQNFGTVNATGLLIIDTGHQTANNGLMEATAGGTLQVMDPLFNAGTVKADGTGALAEFSGAISNANVIKAIDGGTLQFDDVTVNNTAAAEVSTDATSMLNLNGSAILGGTIDNAGQAVVTGTSILHGDTVSNEGTITVGSDASLTLQGDKSLSNAATGVITADGGTVTIDIVVNQDVNDGQILAFNGGIVDFNIDVEGASNHGLIQSGAGGTINFYDNNSGDGGGSNVSNDGGGGGDQGGNYGTMQATEGGVLTFNGGLDNFNQVEADTGGIVNLDSGIKNHAGTIKVTDDGSQINISNGDDSENAATMLAENGGTMTFSSVMLQNDKGAIVEATLDGIINYDTGGLTNDGTFKADLGGSITFGGEIGITNDATGLFEACSDGSITFAADGIAGSVTNDGGRITSGPGGTITFDSTLTGATNDDGGVIAADAHGTIKIDGFVDNNALFNTGGFIAANGTDATVALYGANIVSGTLSTSDGGVITGVSGTSTLDGTTVLGGSTLQAGQTSDSEVADARTLSGQSSADSEPAIIDLTDTTMLSGGTVTFQGNGEFVLTGDDAQIVGAPETNDTLANLGLITGSGQIGDGNANLTIDNESDGDVHGVIVARGDDATLTLDTGTNGIINAGELAGSHGGTLAIESRLDNTGQVDASHDGQVQIDADVLNHDGGQIQAGSCGIVTFDSVCVINASDATIDADSRGTIAFDCSRLVNCGSVSADCGGTVYLTNTTVNNAGGTFSTVGSGSSVQLSDSTIKGGTLAAGTGGTGGAIEVVAAGGANLSVLEGGSVTLSQLGVPSATEWFDTGIAVMAGELVSIAASGIISIGNNVVIDNQNVTDETPAGYSNLTTAGITGEDGEAFLAPGLIPYSLVGQIDGGTPFEIGTATTFTATSSGELFLSINDNYFSDNTGSWNAAVAVTGPPLINTGLVQVEAGANLELIGAIDNEGRIDVDGPPEGTQTNLEIGGIVVLDGAGTITLDGDCDSIIGTGDGGGTLDNVNNTISGAGHIGDGNSLTLINDVDGVVDADTCDETLTVDTGGNVVVNAGLMEATNRGTLAFDGSIVQDFDGTIAALGAGAAVQLFAATVEGGTLLTDDATSGDAGRIDVMASDGAPSVFDGSAQAVTINGFVQVEAGAALELIGTIDTNGASSNGTINLAQTGNGDDAVGATLEISGTVQLDGSGAVTMQGNADQIIAAPSDAQLDNDSTIVGGGHIGAGDNQLTLVNEADGLINANNADSDPLVVDTGGNTIVNLGTMSATGGGQLDVESKVNNSGGMLSVTSGSVVDVQAAIHGGSATIQGGTLQFDSSSDVHVNFENGPEDAPTYGTLVLTDPEHFSGQISGFFGTEPDATHSDVVDLAGFTESHYFEVSVHGNEILTLFDSHGDVVSLTFDNFDGTLNVATSGGNTIITDPPSTPSSSGTSTETSSAGDGNNAGNGSNPNVHDSLAKIYNALTNDHGNTAPSSPATAQFSGSGGDSFVFSQNLGDHGHSAPNAPPVDLSHTTAAGTASSFAPPMPEIHPDLALDTTHVAMETPTAMDQFHQTVAGVTLVH